MRPRKLMIEKAAQLWCRKKTSKFTMIPELATEIAREFENYERELEHLRVQLAGCGVAAIGYCRGKSKVKRGSYGWSASLQDCIDLYEKYRKLVEVKS